MKTCTKCGECKPLDAFHASKVHKYGRQPWCRACKSTACRDWLREFPERALEKRRKWIASNPEKEAEINRRWRSNNPQTVARINADRIASGKNAEYQERRRIELSDSYIRALIRNKHPEFSEISIPADLIEAMRQHLRVKRAIREG